MHKPGVAAETGNSLFCKWIAGIAGKLTPATRPKAPMRSAFDLPPDLSLGGLISEEARKL